MATWPSEGELPIGGAGLGVDEYLEFLSKEYLADFIRRGGASVKVAVVGGDQVAQQLHAGLAAAARAEGYLFARGRRRQRPGAPGRPGVLRRRPSGRLARPRQQRRPRRL